jgi:hypothetical protein
MMKEKYVEERFPRWFEFGVHPDGRVDLADRDGDVITGISAETAAKLLEARTQYVDAMIEIFFEDPEALYRLVEPGRR